MNKGIWIAAFAIIVLGAAYWVKETSLSQNPGDEHAVLMCGRTFLIDPVLKEGVNVAERIATLITAEYEQATKKEETDCYWILQNAEDRMSLSLTVEEKIGEEPEVQGKSIYFITLGAHAYIVDRESGQIYNTNQVDLSIRDAIGNFKH